ncbi:MAG: hypothetical protein J2O46_00375 [Nocardioides sp.]|nr:hypothetical protein [Nocardioides sp.]
MTTVIAVVALVVALAAAVVAWRLQATNRALRAKSIGLTWRLEQAVPASPTPPDLPPGDRLILVRILNPLELANAQTKAATMLHKVRPALLSKIVYEQAAQQLSDRLAEEGVVAEVKIHAGR